MAFSVVEKMVVSVGLLRWLFQLLSRWLFL